MKLSVALCTYNGEKFIRDQLESILHQSVKVDEIVISDDKSTDVTISIINEYIKKFPAIIHLHQNETTLRSVRNFEKAISLCTGDIVFLSDQDDIWHINKVHDYVDYFNQNPNVKVLASNGYCIDENANKADKYSLWDIPQFLREQNKKIDYFKTLTYFSNIATGASMAIKREIIDKILPFPEIKNLHHDEWIAIIAASENAFELLNEKYLYYRIHSNQQVGGVFFDKTEEEKRNFTQVFSLDNKNTTFHNFKIKLRKISDAYKKNKAFSVMGNSNSQLFRDNLSQIEAYYFSTIQAMRNQHPIKSFFVLLWDKITNKRQLK